MVKKINLLWIMVLLMPLAFAMEYQQIDNADIFFKMQYQMSGSGLMELEFTPKLYTGNVDLLCGFNVEKTRPLYFEIFKQINNYTSANGTEWSSPEWTRIKSDSKRNYNYDNLNTWYMAENLPVTAGKNYKGRMYIQVRENAKFGCAIKPSSQTIAQAISNNYFYYIDPIVNLTDMVAYYDFDEASVSTLEDEIDGQNISVGGSGTTSVTGLIGNAKKFSGAGYYSGVNTNLDMGSGNFTYSFWFNSSSTVDTQRIIGYGDNWNNEMYFFGGGYNAGWGAGTKINFLVKEAGGSDQVTTSYADWGDGEFHHYLITKNETGKIHVFMDNTTLVTMNSTRDWDGINNQLIIAARWGSPGSPTEFYKGSVDELGIYDRAFNHEDRSRAYWCGLNGTPLIDCIEDVGTLSVTFVNQTPANITTTNLFTNRFNVTFNIASSSELILNQTLLFYNVTSPGGEPCRYINGTALSGCNSSFTNNISDDYLFSLDGDHVYPGTYNINEDIFENESHNEIVLGGSNQGYSERFYNVSRNKTFSFLEVMFQEKPTNQEIHYCNSSASGNYLVSGDCTLFATYTGTGYNHNHSVNSKHHLINFPIVNGTINGIGVTPVSYFIFRGGVANSLFTIPNVTRADTTRLTNNNGVTWSNQAFTIDSHLHQFTLNDSINYRACSNNTEGIYGCSPITTTYIALINLPPSSPVVTSPINRTYTDENIIINYTSATSITNNITFYNIDLLNNDFSFNSIITANNSLNLNYTWNMSAITNGNYYVKVTATDNESLTSFGLSPLFTISNSEPPVPPTTTPEAIEEFTRLFMFALFIIIAIISYFLSLINLSNKPTNNFVGSMILKGMALFCIGIAHTFAIGAGQQAGIIFFFIVLLIHTLLSLIFLVGEK